MNDSHIREQAFRKRLLTVASQHSQASIAQRTGTPLSNVNRYVRHGKVPTEFTIALLREFKLNPAWLLMGEGSPYLSDVARSSVAMGEDMLALVKAMSAVSEMRLGALAGKKHGAVLRGLNDALKQHEQLRQKLNQHTAPIYEELIGLMRSAMQKRNLELAVEQRDAILQIQRLSDSPELDQRFDYANANLEYMLDNVEGALAIQRRAVRRLLARGEIRDPLQLVQINNLCVGLSSMGYLEEAARTAESAIRLTHPDTHGDRYYQTLKLRLADLDFECGRVDAAIALARSTYNDIVLLNPDAMDVGYAYLPFLYVLAGIAPFESALRPKSYGAGLELFALKFSAWTEDSVCIDAACDSVFEQGREHEPRNTLNALHTLELKRALTDKDYDRAAIEKRSQQKRAGLQAEISALVIRTQLERACGKQDVARGLMEQTELKLRQVSPGTQNRLMNLAIHYRSVLALCPKGSRSSETREIRARAVKFYLEGFRNGYGAFADIAVSVKDEAGV